MSKLYPLLLFCCCYTLTFAQVPIEVGVTRVVDFETTLAGVNEGPFTGAGVAATPTSGQLDADAFAFTGFDSPADLARGTQATAVSTGGLYNFSGTTNGGAALGVQPGGSDFTPGTITVTAVNVGTSTINSADVSFDFCIRNDQGRSTSIQLAYSTDNVNYTNFGPTVATPLAATPTPFVCTNSGVQNISGLSIPAGGNFYLRLTSDDAGGSGSRDEIAVDNFSFTPSAVAMPIQLTSFTATAQRNSVLVQWQTARELDNDYFTVERSLDGKTFDIIGMVQGNGTTDEANDYRFHDEAPAAGTNYYRLTQTDYDGRSETFAVRSVTTGTNGDATVFPHPVRESVTIAFPTEVSDADLQVRDPSGRLVLRQTFSGLQTELDLGALSSGSYLLRINSGAALTVQRLVKL